MNSSNIPEVDSEIPPHAVSVYGNGEAMDDFPVLKAFQQYIDAEQAKARKRMMTLGIFFSVIMFVVIGVFVALLMNVSARNQALNDRLVEYAMKDRERSTPVVVQPSQDNSAILALTAKLEEMQRKLADESRRAADAEKARSDAAAQAAAQVAKPQTKSQEPSQNEVELARLRTQLQAEKNKTAELQAKQKEMELEEYRRKHYPELYAPKKPIAKETVVIDDDEDDDEVESTPVIVKKPVKKSPTPSASKSKQRKSTNKYDDLNALLDDIEEDKAVSYFDEDEKDTYTVPVEIKGKRAKWRIPEE